MKDRPRRSRALGTAALALLALLALLAPALLEAAPSPDAPAAEADEGAQPVAPVPRYGDRVSVFGDTVHVPADTVQMGDVVAVGADAVIEGEVGDVWIVGGTLTLRGHVRGQVVAVLTRIDMEDAQIDGRFVNVAGSLRKRASHVGGRFTNFGVWDWLGRFPSPFGVVGGLMFWRLLLKLLLAFVVVLLLSSLAPERIRLIGEEAPQRYVPALFVGLVGYLAASLLMLLALLTVVGLPVALLLFRVLKWLGIAGIFLAVGRRTGRAMGREMSMLGSVFLAFSLFSLVALSPYLAGFAGAPWWMVLSWHSLVFCGVWIFVAAPGLGLVILTRAGSRSSDAGAPGAPAAATTSAAAHGPLD